MNKYFIILSPGRTGSTLLVKIINTALDNKSFYGEFKHHPITDLSKILKQLEDYSEFIKKSHEHCWVVENLDHPYYKHKSTRDDNWLKENLEFIEHSKQEILKKYFQPKDLICGYKQLFNKDEEVIGNIIKSTDNVNFIINTRDPVALSQSYARAGFGRDEPSGPDDLKQKLDEYKNLIKLSPERFFCIDYSDFTNPSSTNLKDLFSFMGLHFDEQKITEALKVQLRH